MEIERKHIRSCVVVRHVRLKEIILIKKTDKQ